MWPHYSPIVCHKALPQTQLPENIHHYFHRGMVCHGERAHVKYASEFQGPRAFCWKWWGMLGKTDPGTANNPFLLLPGTFFKGREGEGKKKMSKKIYIFGVRSFSAKFNQHYQVLMLICWHCVSIVIALFLRRACAEITKAIYHTALAFSNCLSKSNNKNKMYLLWRGGNTEKHAAAKAVVKKKADLIALL